MKGNELVDLFSSACLHVDVCIFVCVCIVCMPIRATLSLVPHFLFLFALSLESISKCLHAEYVLKGFAS